MAGLSITYAFEVMEALSWMVAMACNLETNSVSLERIMEYFRLPQEPAAGTDAADRSPEIWPSKGEVTFRNYSSRYRDGLDLVLSDLNVAVREKEKLGICGRTGAGKSSISKALFRIIEASEGSIAIDGRDISGRNLHELRSSLTVIPQDPTLFSGSLRFNLDPANQHCDSELWRALDLAHMRQTVLDLSEGLEHPVQERGENFSVGQKQLICLARALLRKSKVLVLDEATAAVDLETDGLIQKTIRTAFADCTIMTIAHRLDTIMDSDRIMVLSEGKVVELDTPENLMGNTGSTFYAMAKAHGLVARN
jgi:ATP-binding cassette subfamily C (CFTR/MRP) protein 1